jgi:hypothetical protein
MPREVAQAVGEEEAKHSGVSHEIRKER